MTPPTSKVYQRKGKGAKTATFTLAVSVLLNPPSFSGNSQQKKSYLGDIKGEISDRFFDDGTSSTTTSIKDQKDYSKIINSFTQKLISNSIDIEPNVSQFIRKRFWDLI